MLHRHKFVRRTAWLAIFFVMIVVTSRAQNLEQPLTLEQYRQELIAAIDQLEATTDDDAQATLQFLQDHFATITTVDYGSGEPVELQSILADLDPSVRAVEGPGDEPLALSAKDVALARLYGAQAQIDASPYDDTAARLASLHTILARPEFNTPMSLWERFWRWIENMLSRWLPDSGPGNGVGLLEWLIQLVPWIVSIVIVAAVLWLLIYWLQHFLRAFVRDARVKALAGEDDMPRTAAEARQQARTAAESGLYRDAVRRLYLAALLLLSERHLITYERSLTNREVLTRVASDSPIRTHLEPVISTFDQVWYGVREPDQATFNAYEEEVDRLTVVAERLASTPVKHGEP